MIGAFLAKEYSIPAISVDAISKVPEESFEKKTFRALELRDIGHVLQPGV